jgi:hypothetical protein
MKLEEITKINKDELVSKLGNLWKKSHRILFFVLLFGAITLGFYQWNRNLYSSTWSNAKKKEFINSQDKGVVLNENNFKKALDIVAQREEENSKKSEPKKDFFKAY